MLRNLEHIFLRSSLRNKLISRLNLEGDKGIHWLGHRLYVGGMWGKVGKLQFDFLVQHGLKPSHCLLDIGCGSLRGGIYFVSYLDRGNYLGIDKEKELIELGIEKELGNSVYKEKQPEFVVSDRFEFDKFSKIPQFSIAHSLFTHLESRDIVLCLRNLRDFVDIGHTFFATFSEGQSSDNPGSSNSLAHFEYSRPEIELFGHETGWTPGIGNWNHPRNQMIMQYKAH